MKAQEQGIARVAKTREQIHAEATATIRHAREATDVLMREGLIAPAPA